MKNSEMVGGLVTILFQARRVSSQPVCAFEEEFPKTRVGTNGFMD